MRKINLPLNCIWSYFTTLECPHKCPYCINRLNSEKKNYNIERMNPNILIRILNSLKFPDKYIQRFSLIGGEPFLYGENIIKFMNELNDKYYITITSNLNAWDTDVDMIETFKRIKRKQIWRMNTSYHPSQMPISRFIRRFMLLKQMNINLDSVFVVSYPGQKWEEAIKILRGNGINAIQQIFIGFYKGKLYPNKNNMNDIPKDKYYVDYRPLEKYEQQCGRKFKRTVNCLFNSHQLLINPRGDIYNCHARLYEKAKPLGNLVNFAYGEEDILFPKKSIECNFYGCCNPCDYHKFNVQK